jgi:hypothetical protein
MRSFVESMRRFVVPALSVLLACDPPPPRMESRPQGVQIFAADTVTARLHISVVAGDLQVNVRGDGFMIRPDKSFLVATPATIEATRGIGTALIESVDSTRIAVVPMGVPEDSIDAATVTGTLVRFTRMGYDRRSHRLVRMRP